MTTTIDFTYHNTKPCSQNSGLKHDLIIFVAHRLFTCLVSLSMHISYKLFAVSVHKNVLELLWASFHSIPFSEMWPSNIKLWMRVAKVSQLYIIFHTCVDQSYIITFQLGMVILLDATSRRTNSLATWRTLFQVVSSKLIRAPAITFFLL